MSGPYIVSVLDLFILVITISNLTCHLNGFQGKQIIIKSIKLATFNGYRPPS